MYVGRTRMQPWRLYQGHWHPRTPIGQDICFPPMDSWAVGLAGLLGYTGLPMLSSFPWMGSREESDMNRINWHFNKTTLAAPWWVDFGGFGPRAEARRASGTFLWSGKVMLAVAAEAVQWRWGGGGSQERVGDSTLKTAHRLGVCLGRGVRSEGTQRGAHFTPSVITSGSSSPHHRRWPSLSTRQPFLTSSPLTGKVSGPQEWLTQHHSGEEGRQSQTGSLFFMWSAVRWSFYHTLSLPSASAFALYRALRWPWPPSSRGLCDHDPFD